VSARDCLDGVPAMGVWGVFPPHCPANLTKPRYVEREGMLYEVSGYVPRPRIVRRKKKPADAPEFAVVGPVVEGPLPEPEFVTGVEDLAADFGPL